MEPGWFTKVNTKVIYPLIWVYLDIPGIPPDISPYLPMIWVFSGISHLVVPSFHDLLPILWEMNGNDGTVCEKSWDTPRRRILR